MTDYLILNSYCKVIFQEKIHIWSGQCNAFIYWIKYFLNLMYMNKTYFPTLYRYKKNFALERNISKKYTHCGKFIKWFIFANSERRVTYDCGRILFLLILICINLLEIYILQLGMNLTRLRKLNNYVENGHFQVI